MPILSPESSKSKPSPSLPAAIADASIAPSAGNSRPPQGNSKSDALASVAFWAGVVLLVLAIIRMTESF